MSCSHCPRRYHRVLCQLVVLLAMTLSAFTGCNRSTSTSEAATPDVATGDAPPEKTQAIAMLYYRSDSPYARAFQDGATSEAGSRELELRWFFASDVETQQQQMEDATAQRFQAICVYPLQADALTDSVEKAEQAGIPIVTCERSLSSESPPSTAMAATDHFHSGQMIAERAAADLDETGSVLIVLSDAAVALDRAMGVKYALKRFPNIQSVTTEDLEQSEIEQADQNGTSATETESTIFQRVRQFLEDLDSDEAAGVIALTAQDAISIVKWKKDAFADLVDVPVYCFGATPEMAGAIKSSEIAATSLENPYLIGASAVIAAADGIAGSPVQGLISAASMLVDADNVDDEMAQDLLQNNCRE